MHTFISIILICLGIITNNYAFFFQTANRTPTRGFALELGLEESKSGMGRFYLTVEHLEHDGLLTVPFCLIPRMQMNLFKSVGAVHHFKGELEP